MSTNHEIWIRIGVIGWSSFLFRILVISGSSNGPETVCPEWDVCFPQSPHANVAVAHSNALLSPTFKFIIFLFSVIKRVVKQVTSFRLLQYTLWPPGVKRLDDRGLILNRNAIKLQLALETFHVFVHQEFFSWGKSDGAWNWRAEPLPTAIYL
jgi:hypothetical protein